MNFSFTAKQSWCLPAMIVFSLSVFSATNSCAQNHIDRKALVERHKVINTNTDSLSSLTVGDGMFAFTVDVTGLQTFPEYYEKGVPLGTQSEWGWHSFMNTAGYKREEALKPYHVNGRDILYSVQWGSAGGRNKEAADWFRQNPHRLQLGNLGFEILKKDGTEASINDLKDIHQELNPWTGEINSHFTVEGVPVEVITCGHQQQDMVAARVQSDLIKQGRLKIRLRFPYPTGEWSDVGTNYAHPEKHMSVVQSSNANGAVFLHQLDTTKYYVAFNWKNSPSITKKAVHDFLISPNKNSAVFEFSCLFTLKKNNSGLPDFTQTKTNSESQWKQYWSRGGAVDFSGSTDPRAFELERRIILSEYLMKAQEAGHYPPQETGLTYNSWYGKAHLEMHYWHTAHYALWGRTDLLEKSLDWYFKVEPFAKAIAQRQGFEGVRWQKMVNYTGEENPSSIGALLIWQQPHFIYFSELVYRDHKDKKTLDKYKDLVFATADFMASFPYYDKEKDRYILGKGVIPAQERYKAEETFNPTYELVYWQWALQTAQKWRERLGMPRNKKWDEVLAKLSPLPEQDGVYLAAESAPDSYTNPQFKTDHPSVFGAYGMLPLSNMLDTATMHRTFDLIWNTWMWNDTWGWDFPMTAMTATRLGLPDKAIDALFMNIHTNTFLNNGHNFQDDRLRLYMPGNGALLLAIPMMVAGYDDSKTPLPGIPKNGKWKVQWEGLEKMP